MLAAERRRPDTNVGKVNIYYAVKQLWLPNQAVDLFLTEGRCHVVQSSILKLGYEKDAR